MECVQHPELFLSLQVFFSAIRSSVFANRPLFKFSSYPPTEPGRLGGGGAIFLHADFSKGWLPGP